MLKPPVWEGWSIGTYFWLGGLSGGAYLAARMAEIFGGDAFRDVSRAGTTVSMLADLPCAPLLIADLGDWSRFHHMLRVWKPQSPMNFGSWVVTGFSANCALAVLREWMRVYEGKPRSTMARVADKSLAVVTDAAGIPLALLMISYTGVLLSGTANPVWTRNRWLAPLFASSAIGDGAAAINLAMQFMKLIHPRKKELAEGVLDKIESAARIAEMALRWQYLRSLGKLNEPLTKGKDRKYMLANMACTIAGEALKLAPLEGKARRNARIASSVLGILGGYALKYGILEAGHAAARDPELSRLVNSKERRLVDSTPSSSEPLKFPNPLQKPAGEVRGGTAPNVLPA
jgi:formate-dependent nitrite reductase membrane component NrfD